jgi:hypothetical protein
LYDPLPEYHHKDKTAAKIPSMMEYDGSYMVNSVSYEAHLSRSIVKELSKMYANMTPPSDPKEA